MIERQVSALHGGIRPVNLGGDFIIVGSGIAGLRAALNGRPQATRDHHESRTRPKATPSMRRAAPRPAIGADDSPALRARDTKIAGDGLCDSRCDSFSVTMGRATCASVDRARNSIEMPTAGPRWRRKARTACGPAVGISIELRAPFDELARVAGPSSQSTVTARSSQRPSPAIFVSRA